MTVKAPSDIFSPHKYAEKVIKAYLCIAEDISEDNA